MFRATKAGALYSIIVFLIGFILGTIRVLLVAPRLGETAAVIIEAPIMLAASWFVCRSCVNWLDVGRTVPARSGMGSVAFLVLMSAEGRTRCCTRSIFGRSACRLQIAPRRDRSWRSDDLCRIPGHSGLAPVRQTFRPAKCRRSLGRQFLVSTHHRRLCPTFRRNCPADRNVRGKVSRPLQFDQAMRYRSLRCGAGVGLSSSILKALVLGPSPDAIGPNHEIRPAERLGRGKREN